MLDPTIQKQHSHIADGFFMQVKDQGSQKSKTNNLHPARVM